MNKLTVNVAKSKVMCVSKRRKKAHRTLFMYDDKQLECVENFKHLSIEFNRLNNTNRAVEQLCKQAKRLKTVIDLQKTQTHIIITSAHSSVVMVMVQRYGALLIMT